MNKKFAKNLFFIHILILLLAGGCKKNEDFLVGSNANNGAPSQSVTAPDWTAGVKLESNTVKKLQ